MFHIHKKLLKSKISSQNVDFRSQVAMKIWSILNTIQTLSSWQVVKTGIEKLNRLCCGSTMDP